MIIYNKITYENTLTQQVNLTTKMHSSIIFYQFTMHGYVFCQAKSNISSYFLPVTKQHSVYT